MKKDEEVAKLAQTNQKEFKRRFIKLLKTNYGVNEVPKIFDDIDILEVDMSNRGEYNVDKIFAGILSSIYIPKEIDVQHKFPLRDNTKDEYAQDIGISDKKTFKIGTITIPIKVRHGSYETWVKVFIMGYKYDPR